MNEVFDVYAYSASFDNASDSRDHLLRGLAEASDDISAEGNRQDPRDSSDGGDHLPSVYHFSVWIPQGDHHPGTRGRHGRKPRLLEDPRARDVPAVGEYQDALSMVKRTKIFSLLPLCLQFEDSAVSDMINIRFEFSVLRSAAHSAEPIWLVTFGGHLMDERR